MTFSVRLRDGIVKFVSWRSFFGDSLAQRMHADLSVWLCAVQYEGSVVRSSLDTCYLFFSFIVVFICLLLLSYSKWGIFPARSPVLYLFSWLVKHCINHVLFTSQPAPPLLLWYHIVNLVQFNCLSEYSEYLACMRLSNHDLQCQIEKTA